MACTDEDNTKTCDDDDDNKEDDDDETECQIFDKTVLFEHIIRVAK